MDVREMVNLLHLSTYCTSLLSQTEIFANERCGSAEDRREIALEDYSSSASRQPTKAETSSKTNHVQQTSMPRDTFLRLILGAFLDIYRVEIHS